MLEDQKKKLDAFCDQSYKNVSSLAALRKIYEYLTGEFRYLFISKNVVSYNYIHKLYIIIIIYA